MRDNIIRLGCTAVAWALICVSVSGCAQPKSPPTVTKFVCIPTKDFTQEELRSAAEDLKILPASSEVFPIFSDWMRMRSDSGICEHLTQKIN